VLVAAAAAAPVESDMLEVLSLMHQPSISKELDRNVTRRVKAYPVEVGCVAALGLPTETTLHCVALGNGASTSSGKSRFLPVPSGRNP
jgi:hypothetical protein